MPSTRRPARHRPGSGGLSRGAHDEARAAAAVAAIEAAVGIDPLRKVAARADDEPSHLLRYDDARRGHARRVLVRGDALAAVSLRGDWSAEGWLKEYLEAGTSVAQLGRLLLKPGTAAPAGFKSRGRVLGNCGDGGGCDIGAARGGAAGSPAERLSRLQAQLKCGTQCGSCLPEVKRMITETRGTVSA